ncbi:protein phosphatase 2C 51-like [Vitis riparia]|uniref:protein phosphatase 2C 51-like n=1 Tax=Vitis riparia TaxID=96939 RepID=UPI00155A91F6|nr:protein phosphatase 2C 51-like [Vitis riparia]
MDSVETIKPRVDPQLGADAYVKKRRTGIKEEASFRSSKGVEEESKMDDGAVKLNSELSTSGSSAPESSASQSGGASDGEVVSESEEQGGKEGEKCVSTCVPHGSMSVIGRRRAMEDALTVAPGEFDSYDFYAVYDGHGGAKVAYACRDRLHRLLAKEIEDAINGEGRIDWENVMVASFSKMDEEINGEASQVEDRSTSSLLRSMGSTAVVVVVGPEKLVVANCGDSRAVLCRRGVAVPLSRDHKPDRPDERERVEAAGGKVINWNGFRILGVLSTSRSIGDYFLKPYVTPKPEVTVWEREEFDDFIVIASDGLWDVITNELACKIVRKCFDGQIRRRVSEGMSRSCAAKAAAMLTELAMAQGSKDNISVVVVELKKHLCQWGLKLKNPNSPSH